MKKLLVYLKDYKKESVLGPLFKLLEATFELIVPLVMAAIIDTGVATGDKSYIMKMCMVLVLLAVIGLTCSITAQYFAAKAAVRGISSFFIRFKRFLRPKIRKYAKLYEINRNNTVIPAASDQNV